MIPAPLPSNESARLSSLRALHLLDTPAEPDFDEIVELASILCEMPMALVSLVDEGRQWFKARVGLDATETPREVAFCAHAILRPDETLAVPDATVDERFHDNPLVTGAPDLRAYFGRPLRAPDGSAVGTLCVLDTTPRTLSATQLRALTILAHQVEAQIELRSSRDRAISLAEAKSRFLATMSHEIRTPLHGMIGTLELLLEDALEESLRDDLGAALTAGRQLHGLLSSVLDISKASADLLELEPRPTCLRELVAAVAATFTGTARKSGVVLRHSVGDAVPLCSLVDATRLTQVLGNLLGNAVKFTHSGTVDLEVCPVDDGKLRFSVRDTGPGIPAQDLERIFERFEQAEHTAGGTGIGLALAREIVELMGGSLRATSEVGVGSCFWFEVEVPQACSPETVGPTEDSDLPDAHVLLVDDEALNLRIGARVLERMGLRVTAVFSGEEALACILTGEFDVVLLDCYIGAMTGFEVSEAAHAELGEATPPILALTASALGVVRERCFASGMCDVLEKPIDRKSMRQALARSLRKVPRPVI